MHKELSWGRSLATEAIEYQKGDMFHKNLTGLLNKVEGDIADGIINSNSEIIDEYGTQITDLIRKRFNLNIVPVKEFSEISPLAIIPFSSDMIDSALNGYDEKSLNRFVGLMEFSHEEIFRKYKKIISERKRMAKRINNKKGKIDFNKAYVSGYFSEVTHYLILDLKLLFGSKIMTPAQVSSAIIHEVGHAFHGLELHYRFTTTNLAISHVMSSLEQNNVEEAIYRFRSSFGAEDLIEASINKDSTREDFYGVVVEKYMKGLESHYGGNGWYDQVSFEFMADNFVTRLGAGGDLVVGLDALSRKLNFDVNRNPYKIRVVSGIYHLLIFTAMGMSGGTGLVVAMGAYLLFVQMLMARVPEIYDGFKDRGVRVSQDIANILKDRSLPDSEKEMLITQFELTMDINKLNKNFTPLFVAMWKKILPSLRKADYYKKMEQRIESGLNNPLFVTVARLDTLS